MRLCREFPFDVDQRDIQIEEELDNDKRAIKNPICVEDERHRHGQRWEPVAKRAVHESREERDQRTITPESRANMSRG
jgi:hypothetical protein